MTAMSTIRIYRHQTIQCGQQGFDQFLEPHTVGDENHMREKVHDSRMHRLLVPVTLAALHAVRISTRSDQGSIAVYIGLQEWQDSCQVSH
jgi:hypothetical protein